jgi:hypothetical protein
VKLEIEIDTKDFERTLRKLSGIVDQNWRAAGNQFRQITPRRSGNAQSKSSYNSNEIRGDYPYAGRLDEGYSKQAPAGMSDPTIRYFENGLEKDIGRL